MVSFVKNWFKSWALWVWALFIGLLASESELLPKLQSAEIKEDIPKKKIIIKKKKKVIKNEVSENEGKIEETETDREGKGQEDQDICLSPENVTHEEESEIYVTDENVVLKGSENHVIDESLVLESKNNGEIEIVLPETDNLVDDTIIESEENSDNNEEDNIPWIGAVRGSGLTRYSGVQNLMDTEEDNDQPLVVERRAPVLIPRREGGPLTLTRGSLIKSLSHEKVRLEEIPEEDRHPSPRNVESALEDTDKIWAQLVARYTEANSVEKRNQDGSDTFENKFIKDSVRDFTDENMTSKEFSDEVGKRLQMYLEMVGDNVELQNNRREEGTNEIEDENEKDLGLGEDGKHKIFIMIEDDESSGDKEETDDVFSKDYMDIKVSDDHSEADIQEHFEKDDEEKNFEEIEPTKVLECEQLGLGEGYYDEQEETQTQKISLPGNDENATEITQTPSLIKLETVDSIAKEETTDYPNDFDNMKRESEPLVEVQETASKDEEAPVFTIKIRKKSKPTIIESELLSESSTSELSSNVKNEDHDREKEKEESFHQDSKSVVEDVPAVTFILPKKKKKKETVEEKKIEEKTENQKSENDDLSLSSVLQSTDMKGGLPNEYHDSSVTNTRGEKREGETVDPYSSKRRSSRDLWKMEVEKFLEDPNTIHRERKETDKEDIFSTRFEEFPEDYIVEEDISDHPVTESNEDKIFVEEVENTDFERTANISEDHVETKESTSKVSEFQGEQIESEKDGNEKDNTFKDNDFEISANKRKLDENFCEEILETNLTKDLDINEEKSSKKLKDDMEYIHEESEPPCKIEVPKPVQLIDVCDILTNSEQNLVARILTRKNKDDVEESGDYDSEQSSIIEFKEEFSKDEPASPKIEEFTDKLEDEGQEIVECALVEEDKLLEHLDTDEKLLSIKSQELEHEASPAEVLSTVPKSEKDIVLESIRKERDPNTKDFVDDSDLPDYLEDVKDLLVPRVRRKKTRRCDPLNEILKIKEPDHDKTPIATSSKDNILDFNKTHEEDMNEAASLIRKKASDDSVSRQNDEFSLTEEEMKELEEINKEQEAYRAAQRKELEKFLAMPAALTEQEQRELEEFLAEEETDKVAIAASEARLEALLSEVRKRLAESGMDVDDENLDRYMTLPTDLTEEEERLLSIDDDEEEEKGRNDFDSEEDYREYIKQRYLQELEEDRIRVEEEELEFGEYYDDDEDYNYEAEEDYGEGEYLESDFVVMSENEKEKVDTKDEAVGTEEEEEEASNFEEKKSKKGKKFFSLGGPQSTGSSSKGSSSKGSRASLDKQSSKGSSLEGLVEDDTNLEPSNQQSKKFFRFGSLSIKRKKKNNDEYSECDPVINKIEKEVPDANEEINTENKLARKNTSHFAKLIAPKGSSEECDLKRKENMLLLLKIMKKHNKASNTMDVRNGTESKDLLIRVINSNNNSNNNKNNNNNPHEITCINENLGKLSLESKDISDRSPNSSHCSSPCSKNTRDLPCTNVETNDWEFLDVGDTETSLRNSSNSKSEKVSRDSLTCKSLLVNDESTEKPTRVVDTPYSNSSPLADDTEGFVFIQTDRKSATNSAAPTPSCHLTSDREIDECKNRPILTEVSNLKDTEMSRAGGRLATKSTKPTKTTKPTANGVSVNNDDCLDGLLDSAYDVSTTVQSAASNPSLSCSKLSPQNSVECLDRQPSLQELIEAELTARFAPLQPDSLEGLITQEYHEHTRTIINGNDVTSSCTALLDSLEEQPFSLDSLADAESGVDLTSPHNPNSGDHSPIPPNPIPDDSSNFSVNVIDMSVYNHNHISNTTTESDALLIDSSHHHHHHHHTNHFVQVEPSSNLREEHSDLSVSGNVDGNDIDNTSEVNTSQNFKDNIDSEIFINGLKNEKIDNSVPVEFDPTIKISDNDIDDNDEEFVNNEKLLALECKEEINHDSDALLQEHTERVNEKQVTSDVAISEDCKTVNSSKPKEDFPGSENALKVVDNSPLLNTCEKFANNDSFSTSVVSNIQIESVPNLEDSDKRNEDPEIVSVSNPLVNNFGEHASNDSSAVEENIENVADKNLIDTELNETEKDFYDIEVKTVDLDKVQDHSLLNGPPDKSTFDTKSLNEFEEFEVQLSNGDTHPVEQNDPTDSKDINHQISPDLSFDVTNCQNAISVDRISETRSANDLNVAKNSELSSFNVTNGNVKDEELWPEESKPSSKAVFDDFEKMEKEVILEMEKENEEKNMKREGDKKGKKKKKKKTDSEKENKSLIAVNDLEETYDENVDTQNLIPSKKIVENGERIRSSSLHLSEDETDPALNVSAEDDDLSNISVKQLTASYLSCTEHQQQKQQRSPTPVRSHTPIAQLVEAYSPPPPYSRTSTPIKNTPNVKSGEDVPSSYPQDFTPLASLKTLKSAYESNAKKSSSPTTNDSLSAKKEVQVSFSQLREAYCNVAFAQQEKGSTTPRSVTPSKIRSNIVPIFQNMTQSCGDLTLTSSLNDKDDHNNNNNNNNNSPLKNCRSSSTTKSKSNFKEEDSLTNVSVRALTRSFCDLTRVGARFERTDSRDAFGDVKGKENDAPRKLTISVKQLRASYEDIPRTLSTNDLSSPKDYRAPTSPNKTLPKMKLFNKHGSFANDVIDRTDMDRKTAYQNKDELYEKHVGPRIRSFDAAKMKNKFNKPKEPTQVSSDCRICGKQVFQMEKIVAEKASWHKNCFRCKECNKNLTLETYQSHEGSLYCKPHFKELFRPKAVVQDEAEERKERLLRRPKMIVLESNPEQLPDDVVRATSKPDYGLEELQQTLNIQERFAVFENFSKEEEKPKPEPISVRRSQSLMSKAASRFFDGQEDGEDNEDDEEEYDEEEEEEEEEEEGEGGEEGNQEGSVVKSRNKKRKERPMSFSGMGDLKAAWEQKQRREELSQSRKEEITRFRQMLCAGKNLSLKEKFESGQFDDHENGETNRMKEEIKIEGKRAASNLKKRFEQGEPFILEDDDEVEGEEGTPKRRERICSEKQEVEEIFKEAETAKKARNVFKQIDSKVSKEGTTILRSQSFASSGRENRHSMDVSVLMQQHREPVGEVVKADEKQEDFSVDTTDLASRFRFFLNYEKEKEKEMEKNRKVFRITPPREGIDQVEDLKISKANMPKPCMAVNCAACKLRRLMGDDDTELLGRDPNLIKCSDNYQDDIDCRNTRNILQMFKKMEMGEEEEEEDEGPKPLKRFTPPPGEENENDETDEEYSDEEYSDEDEEEDESDHASKVRDELLQMSARKAASLRAKFERWEAEVERKNDINKDKEEVGEECMPSLDTAKNLKAMFEHKAIEVAKPVASKPIKQKVNRFV